MKKHILLYFFLVISLNALSQHPSGVLSCTNWLSAPSDPSYADVGNLNITGNKITVEATINRTQPYSIGTGGGNEGDIVSKHLDPSDVNYLLRPNHAYITTTNGFFGTPDVCEIQLNKTYHVAMVYDGVTLKFYRNGYLMSQVAATGNLFQNSWPTRIGRYTGAFQETFLGYINEVRIWNVARTQAQIQSTMNISLPSPTTQPGLQAYYTFDNLLNKQGNPAWNGSLGGAATINATNPSCTFTADSCALAPCIAGSDYTFSINPCNPLSVNFSTSATTFSSIKWDFGDGSPNNFTPTPTHLYSTTGNYSVKMILFGSSCSDTVTKSITVNIQNDNSLITTNDTTICFTKTKQLLTRQNAVNFCWSPTTYLSDPNSANPVTSTPQNITYYYTALTTGNNLITNGSFTQGNTGFTSQYTYATTNTTEGEYFVGPNPTAWNASLSSCTDHTGTSGNGNMLLVNGAPVANIKVWSQSVTVTPNTNYTFSAWIQALYPPNPALLRFSINGIDIGSPIMASLPTCTWSKFYTTWNSGNITNANISIVNQNTLVQGNDFALDDISFAPVTIQRDSVKITVDTPLVTATGTTSVCAGLPAQLNAFGAATYSWTPATGLSNANISNPVATPASTASYTVTGTTVNGCIAQAPPLTITVLPKPVIAKSNDTTICKSSSVQLFASGGNSYTWTPAATLSNPNIANPVATPNTSVTRYYVTVVNTTVNTCSSKDSIQVTQRPDPIFTVSAPQSTCVGTAAQLNASGGNIFLWSPAGVVTNPAIANPMATANTTTNYSVTITESTCNITTTLATLVTVNPNPVVSATRSNDIDCSSDFASLLANGASQYSWTPVTGLNNSTIANPIAKPTITTQYIVKGANIFGCFNYDTVVVAVTTNGKSGYYMPNSFTPNGDGLNDCFGIKYWGAVQEFQFIIYNRYGEKVFGTTDPNQCWDGIYKSKKPEPGNYVYYIKAKTACGDVEKKGNVLLIR